MIAFSWNLPGGVLPYTYTTDDPAQLPAILAAGAGAGVVSWNKTNWLLTTYVGSAPVITSQPQSVTLAPSNSVTFTVIASGSGNLFYQWYRNTNSILVGAPNFTFTQAVGNQLQLSWPADHLGWRLQIQTNDLGNGLSTNWATMPNSANVTSTNILINPANGAVFLRLVYP